MQLKKVELNGFKSFANKTELIFQDGVTTIVGPNGSGKSNISDAVKWVLGEQSAKSLRGGKMEDVIFAGTESRKMVGYAEVVLTLTNESHKLPVDYEEVEITRRLYRSGESQYFINKNQCRLKDIQELFMDTGVGIDGYSIISQGKIDEVLSSKSDERRSIFEEAAGIVKYKTRKEEAEKKLKHAEENLLRVTDILNEITENLTPLQEQAIVARRYLEIKEDLKYIDVCTFVDELEKSTSKTSELLQLMNVVEHDIAAKEYKIREISNEKANCKTRVENMSIQIEKLQEEFFSLKEEAIAKKNSIASDLEKKKINEDVIAEYKKEIEDNNSSIEETKKDIAQKNIKKENYLKDKIKFEQMLTEKEEKLKVLSESMSDKDLEIEKVKEEVSRYSEENAEKQAVNNSILENISNAKKRIEKINADIQNKISEIDSSNIALEEKENNKNAIANEIKKLEEEIQKESLDIEKYNSEKLNFENNKKELETLLDKKQSEYNVLVELEKHNEGYSKSVKTVLEYAKNKKGIHGTVASLIKPKDTCEYAVECLLGNVMQNIVVDTEDVAKEAIEYLKTKNVGRATFLPLSSVQNKNKTLDNKVRSIIGFVGFAKELVSYDAKYEKVMDLAFSNSIVVDNIQNAISLVKKINYSAKVVTLDGEILNNTGSISGGSTRGHSVGLIGRNKKIEMLREEIASLEEKLASLSLDSKLEEKLESANNNLNMLNANKLEKEIAKNSAMHEIEYLKENVAKTKNAKEKLLEDIQEENRMIAEYEQTIASNKETVENNKQFILEKQDVIDEYSRFNKEKSDEADMLNEDIIDLKVSLSSFDDSANSVEEVIATLNESIANLEKINISKQENISKLEKENSEIVLASENIDAVMQEYDLKIKEKENAVDAVKKEKSTVNDRIEKIDNEVTSLNGEVQSLKEEKIRLENRKEKVEAIVEAEKNRMWNEYEVTASRAKDILKEAEEKIVMIKSENANLKKYSDKLRAEIKDMGNVNVSAIEEYAKTKERYDFLTTQKEDLENTKVKLLDLIDQMVLIMKKQFKTQFKIINENFNEVFKNLFGGGKANLELEDEGNILECGIDIRVQPPGKKLQNMSLLSGGERALTAIALLFAILKIKAPPFCILDEIEAALDDVNVQRFAKYIKKYSDGTQFIVITHRKGTMEVAKTVYGVTMQEYGISNIISMKMK